MTCITRNISPVWIHTIEACVKRELSSQVKDGSHDFGHLQRVSRLGLELAKKESANELVVFAASMLHDIVNLPKNHPEISSCSKMAALRADKLLADINFPAQLIPHVHHAIHAHSFSAKIEPTTIEAKCVQDADRMESLGALGLMRVFYVSGKCGSKIMDEQDPEGINRSLNDKAFALDHFVQKLFTLATTMKTDAGRKNAEVASDFLKNFRTQLIKDQKEKNRPSIHFLIATCYHQAGKENKDLFHPLDPFAKERSFEPQKYALDHLLKRDEDYIRLFKERLQLELTV